MSNTTNYSVQMYAEHQPRWGSQRETAVNNNAGNYIKKQNGHWSKLLIISAWATLN